MNIEQFESYAAVGQIEEQKLQRLLVLGCVYGGSKNVKAVLRQIDQKIEMLKRGYIDEEDLVDLQMDSIVGKSVGPLSDAGLSALGIVPEERTK
jgi:hypothetical protein